MLQKIRSLVLDNFVIKLFSLLFAVSLWLHVVTKGKSEVNFVLPLELKDIPKDTMVVGDIPGYVDVRLMGQEGMVKSLSPRDVSAFISLKDATLGESVYYLSPENVKVPTGISISRVSPVEVKLKLDELAVKKVPVRPQVEGSPAPGFRVDKIEVTPREVGVAGPASVLKGLRSVKTGSVDIEGITGGFEKLVPIEQPPHKSVTLDDNSVKVVVTLSKK